MFILLYVNGVYVWKSIVCIYDILLSIYLHINAVNIFVSSIHTFLDPHSLYHTCHTKPITKTTKQAVIQFLVILSTLDLGKLKGKYGLKYIWLVYDNGCYRTWPNLCGSVLKNRKKMLSVMYDFMHKVCPMCSNNHMNLSEW